MNKLRGFSLLEVLVTLLLVTVGVLGMVAMQGRAIQYTADSLHRTQAALLANELVEIIRATPTAVTTDTTAPLYFAGTLPVSTTGSCLQLAEANLISRQIECWGSKVTSLLPGADQTNVRSQFYVCLSTSEGVCGNGAAVEIQLAWRAAGEQCFDSSAADSGICVYRVRTQI